MVGGVDRVGVGVVDVWSVSVVTVVVSVVVCAVSVVEIVLSSLLILMTGISNAVLTNLSSIDGGSPFFTMRSAFLSKMTLSFSMDMRYMVSSPASTVSHRTRILRSTRGFSVGYCDNSAFQCADEEDSMSR